MKLKKICLAIATIGACNAAAYTHAQQVTTAPADKEKIQKVEVTGSLIKRSDAETPSPVSVITAESIKNSGYTTVEDLLRATSAVDTTSVGDGAASGFVSGVATASLRGFGSQGTLVLINGRRIAPVGAVDFNFGRANMVNLNTIPKSAIERIEILRDGASAIYGSDAMAGVINYVLKKEFQGVEAGASMGASGEMVGKTRSANVSFGYGNLDQDRFNVYGGIEVYQRDPFTYSQLQTRGKLDVANANLISQGGTNTPYFFPDSAASFNANYYGVPNTGGPTSSVNSLTGSYPYLGTLPGCDDSNVVGKGVSVNAPTGGGTYPLGQCRTSTSDIEAMSKQDRIGGSIRANFLINETTTAYVDLMASSTKTKQDLLPASITGSLYSAANNKALTWAAPSGNIIQQSALILPIGHKDNPTNGTATPRAVQLLYRFADIDNYSLSEQKGLRISAGLIGTWGAWDYDASFMHGRTESSQFSYGRLTKSGLDQALTVAGNDYRFGKVNTAAAIAQISGRASIIGESQITSLDVRGSRPIFKMAGGTAAIAAGLETRYEKFSAQPDDNYISGNWIPLRSNFSEGDRKMYGAFTELSLPVIKEVEVQAAIRAENYNDFGQANTGKLGFKWGALPKTLTFRGTASTGYRAPAISQLSKGYSASNHSNSADRGYDPIRCDLSDPAVPKSRATPSFYRDCNVIGNSSVTVIPLQADRPPSGTAAGISTLVSPNPNLKPETSQSFTLGLIYSATKDIDIVLDAWYLKRQDEIRVQAGIDLVRQYFANPAAFESFIIRDTNPATWLPGIPNSGPILALKRVYDNYNYTATSGLDYEVDWKLPPTSVGRFKVKLAGTYTNRFDYQIKKTDEVRRYAGVANSGISNENIFKTKASLRLDWNQGDYSAWLRQNYSDSLVNVTSSYTCKTNPSAAQKYANLNGWCNQGIDDTIDLGVTYSGFKNMRLSLSVLNAADSYKHTLAGAVPSAFSYVDTGIGQVGRRWNLSLTYSHK